MMHQLTKQEKSLKITKDKYPFIKVLHRDKSNGGRGKASAMNQGFSYAQVKLCFVLTLIIIPTLTLLKNSLEKFADPNVGAVQGRVVVLNEPQNIRYPINSPRADWRVQG